MSARAIYIMFLVALLMKAMGFVTLSWKIIGLLWAWGLTHSLIEEAKVYDKPE